MSCDHVPAVIVGGGVVGLSIARELLSIPEYQDGVFVFDKAKHLGDGQSGRNSGVVHAGIYYPPDSNKARLCVEGKHLLVRDALHYGVPWKRTEKFVVATRKEQRSTLENLIERARKNSAGGVRLVSGEEVRERVPAIHCDHAVHVLSTGIIDASSYLLHLRDRVTEKGGNILMQSAVVDVSPHDERVEFTVRLPGGSQETYATDLFINAAGLYADTIARMIDATSPYVIHPVRGEYYHYTINRDEIDIKGVNVYQCPELRYDHRGIERVALREHFTPTFDHEGGIGKTVLVGPTSRQVSSVRDLTGSHEVTELAVDRFPREHFYEAMQHVMPGLKMDDLQEGDTGIRATLNTTSDVYIARSPWHPNCINVLGTSSPCLTAAPAIGRYVREMVREEK
jgi:L-2-hydroxyglutarate oxidase LhgO